MNTLKLLKIFSILIIILSTFAIAVGSSTRTDNSVSESSEKTDDESFEVESLKENCNSKEIRKNRIKCRLRNAREKAKDKKEENDGYEESESYEACTGIRNPKACQVLYRNLNKCYELNGRAKDQCFKRAIGFTRANLKDENEDREKKAREYVVAMLYDMQERIEDANKNGEMSDENSADIIDLIVEIKQDILDGARKNEVRPKFQELKFKIKEVRRSKIE